jgi:hypothetical protein
MPDRYVVRELEGDLTPREGGVNNPVGMSVIVLDSRINYRLVREFKTEGLRPGVTARARARKQAAELAAHLNEAAS